MHQYEGVGGSGLAPHSAPATLRHVPEHVCVLIQSVSVWLCDCCEHTCVTVTNIIVPLSWSEANAGVEARRRSG